VGLHEADIAPAVRVYPILGTGEHRVGQVDADDPAVGTDYLLDQREVQPCPACDVDYAVTRAKAERLDGPEALCPMGVAGHGVEPGGDVVVLRLLAVRLDQAISPAVGLAHHLGLRAFTRRGLDRSLDRRHLAIAYALNTALETAGDRTHDAREVDLNPHHGVGLPIVRRLEFHSPARRGRTHSPGERHVAGRLDSGHLFAPAVSPPQVLRPLLHPRAGLKRPSSANPAFANRWRPLRPASDVADISPHLTDAAGDCYAALGSDCHRAPYWSTGHRIRGYRSGRFRPDHWSFQDGCSLRVAQAYCARGRSGRSLSLVWSVPSRAGSTAAVVRRSVAGVGDARHAAILRARRRGQPGRREGPAGRGGCRRRWSRALRAARPPRRLRPAGRGRALR